ncbi:MAG: hypothetical protein DWQ07_19585 [Chloroflexi bacterium]|nr:MAG: hypothetical protein DWQ07_19585 [Chloroflexota bacterium]MBL1194285.1 hypothetical protein [Chloroflexota bacterium]
MGFLIQGQAHALVPIPLDVDTVLDDASLTTCNSAVANDCSLRGAVITANASLGNDVTINVPAGVYDLTIGGALEDNAQTGDLDLRNNINIIGAGIGVTFIEADQIADRVFHVLDDSQGSPVETNIEAVSINSGQAGLGGNIFVAVDNALELRESAVTDGVALLGGGGFYNNGGTLEIRNSSLLGNSSLVGGGAVLNANDGSTLVRATLVDDNDAIIVGGGLYNFDGTMVVRASIIEENFATAPQVGRGGGIANDVNGVTTVEDSILRRNDAHGSDYGGGGIYNAGELTLDLTLVASNEALNGAGGGIYADAGTTTLNGSEVTGNIAHVSYGGGIAGFGDAALVLNGTTVDSNEILNNSVTFSGGAGIYSAGDLTTSDDTIIEDNSTIDGYGGGISLDASDGAATATLTDTRVRNNEAASGGGIYVHDGVQLTGNLLAVRDNEALSWDGGGIYIKTIDSQAIIVLTDARLRFNIADGWGGGIKNEGGSLELIDSLVEGNSANIAGGLKSGDGPLGIGILTLRNTDVIDNTASAFAGGVRVDESEAYIYDSLIDSNSAGQHAGGLMVIEYSNANANVLVDNTQISNNTTLDGGGIWMRGGSSPFEAMLTLTDSIVRNNTATGDGGGIWVKGESGSAKLIVNSSTIGFNHADGNGGGIFQQAEIDLFNTDDAYASVVLNNATLSTNSANGDGGGIYVLESPPTGGLTTTTQTWFNSSSLINNLVGAVPNVIHAFDAEVSLRNSIVSDTPYVAAPQHCTLVGSGVINSLGYNLESDVACGFTAVGDLQSITDPVDSIAINGGPTGTHALPVGHPAIDAGNPAGCEADLDGDGIVETVLAEDQRHLPRGAICDIGSYESQ